LLGLCWGTDKQRRGGGTWQKEKARRLCPRLQAKAKTEHDGQKDCSLKSAPGQKGKRTYTACKNLRLTDVVRGTHARQGLIDSLGRVGPTSNGPNLKETIPNRWKKKRSNQGAGFEGLDNIAKTRNHEGGDLWGSVYPK